MEVFLSSNGNNIKVSWRTSGVGAAMARPYLINSGELRKRSTAVRAALKDLNDYVIQTRLNEERDPEWKRYFAIMGNLKNEGRLLRSSFINAGWPEDTATSFDQCLRELPINADVNFYCSDQDVTIPLGFIFEGEKTIGPGPPSRANFDGFWINRMRLGVRLDGTDCATSTPIDNTLFRSLFALHKKEMESAVADLLDLNLRAELEQFESLITIHMRDHYAWDEIQHKCAKMRDAHSVFFVFAHSDGMSLQLDEFDTVDWSIFRTIIKKGAKNRIGLVILNCCASAIGAEGSSLLSIVNQPGFCGMIGTEAEVMNTYAFRCGVHLMWNLCAKGKKLGDAFTEMQNDETLFPINLFYTCYAARDFQLDSPLKLPMLDMP